ncbi:hypothetical protein HMPREF1624_04370 [Sporothrix schenckii ATCC 58251]|uniref:Transcription initiation protein SPT3 n=1 Tax=Sporothrix schenckii (strain ATCC 58251 / de Perez 2211183) TaxID=1391915 RepID=U7PWP6_SPOS1|nr:hypothetical protein HMPREF1624_04370 [Sporothrix schenckii ATCC 58251]
MMKPKDEHLPIILLPPVLPEPYQGNGSGSMAVDTPHLTPVLPISYAVASATASTIVRLGKAPTAAMTEAATATSTTTAPVQAPRCGGRMRVGKKDAPSIATPPTGVFYPPGVCVKAAKADAMIQNSTTIKRRKSRAKPKDSLAPAKCTAIAVETEAEVKVEERREREDAKLRAKPARRPMAKQKEMAAVQKAKSAKKEEPVQYTRHNQQTPTETPTGAYMQTTEMHYTAPMPNLARIRNDLRESIIQMMYVSGETGEPSLETLSIIEEIVRQQVIELLRSCTELAARRGSRSITINDLIFQIRHDAPKVSRLRTFLSWKDVRKNVKDSDDKGADVDIGGGDDVAGAPIAGAPVEDAAKKNKKNKQVLPWEPVSYFNQEVPERDEEEDEEEEEMNYITLQRLRKADERTKAMTREEYVTWSEYRQASFTYRKSKRFREWAGFGVVTDSKPSDDIVDILGFLTFEMVQTLTEEALRIKDHEDQWKERTGDEARGSKKRKLAQGLFNLPGEGRTPVEVKHIQEAFRRLQVRQKKYRAMLNGTRLSSRPSLKLVFFPNALRF